MTEIRPPGPEDVERANLASGHAHHRNAAEPVHVVSADGPRPSGGAKAAAAIGARALVWSGDPPFGVRLCADGHPPVLCDVTRTPGWDTEAAGWAVWLATPRGPLPPGTRLVAEYLPDGAVIAGRGFPPLYSEVAPRRVLPPPGPPKPGPGRKPRKPRRPVSEPASEAGPAPVAPGRADADTGRGVPSLTAGHHPWRTPSDAPPADDDPGWCPDPPRGCGYHRNARGHKITCLGQEP
jgi:hypothetical protein